jgi:hypothetical protein
MTTAQQRNFYFPKWNACAAKNGWVMVHGRLATDLAAQKITYDSWRGPAHDLYFKIVEIAEHLALAGHRAVIATDLRHACNYVVSCRLSSEGLDNKQTNKVIALFLLLADPENTGLIMNWLNPENAEHDSFVAYLRKQAHEGVLIAIASNAFGTKNWQDLDIGKLRWICKKVHIRPASGYRNFYPRPAATYAPVPDPDVEPF